MLRATRIVRRPAVKPERVADTLTLDHESRHRRRIALTSDGGLEILLDLDRATILADGDAVRLEDDRLVVIKAAGQKLLEVTAETPLRLMRLAWHIGNRHTPAEITADALYIEDDHVLAEMVRGLGGTATQVTRPFQPERGAYEEACNHPDHNHGHSHGHSHRHDHHGHAHDHGHDHAHSEAHSHSHAEAHAHSHAEAHSHAHAHSHEHGAHDHDHGSHEHGGHSHAHKHDHA